MNNLVIFSNLILGSILIYSYYFFGSKNKDKLQKLWGKIEGIKRIMTISSMLVATVTYLFTIYYLAFETDKLDNKYINNIVAYQVILILASMLWMPLSIKYLKKKELLTKIAIILILFIVSMCSLAIFYKIYKLEHNNKYKNLALLGSIVLFFQTFFVDFLNWNYNFF